MNKTAIILPAYNEEKTIAATIKDFHKALPDAEIWVINNRSTDNTRKKALDTILNLRCLGGVIDEMNLGKGRAIRRAFLDIDAEIYIMADADFTYPAYDVHKLILPIVLGEADIVIGDRHSSGSYATQNNRPFHNMGNQLVRFLVNFLFNVKLNDIMSGYRVLNKFFVKNYPILVKGFEIETDMILHALDKNFRIIEISIDYKKRPLGSFSKLNTFYDGLKIIKTIVNIFRHYQPLIFFSFLAFLMVALAFLAGAPVIKEYVDQKYIHHLPLAILAASFMILAFIFLAIGLILDSIIHQERRNFELNLLSRK
jgi:glycosyltransferase involved in cell wall biosynthesis